MPPVWTRGNWTGERKSVDAQRSQRFKEMSKHETALEGIGASTDIPCIDPKHLHIACIDARDELVFSLSNQIRGSTSLESLDLFGNNIGDTMGHYLANTLSSNTHLKTLSLGGNILGNTSLMTLGRCIAMATNLTTLSLVSCFSPIADSSAAEVLRGVAFNQNLRSVDLSGNAVRDEACWVLSSALASHRSLEVLRLDCNEIGDSGGFSLGEALLTNDKLTMLSINNNKLGSSAVSEFLRASGQPNSKLKVVDLSHNEAREIDQAAGIGIGLARHLVSLSLEANRLKSIGALGVGLVNNSSLITLNLSNNEIQSLSWFNEIWQNQKLETLLLHGNQLFEPAILDILHGLMARKPKTWGSLKFLSLHDNFVEEEHPLMQGVKSLMRLGQLIKMSKKSAKAHLGSYQKDVRTYWAEVDVEERKRIGERHKQKAEKLLRSRTKEEEEKGILLDVPIFARVPGTRTIQLWKDRRDMRGADPVWYYCMKIEKQRKKDEKIRKEREERRQDIMMKRFDAL